MAASGDSAQSTADLLLEQPAWLQSDFACIRFRESTNNYADHGGGAYQFEDGTWQSVTGLSGSAQDYSDVVQDNGALKLYQERGWEPWTTRTVCGLG